MLKRGLLLLLFLLGLNSAAHALPPVESGPLLWRFSGFVKSFSSMTQGGDLYRDFDLTARETFWDDSTRMRLRSNLALGDALDFVVHYEMVGQIGDAQRLRYHADELYGDTPLGDQIVSAIFPQTTTPQYFDLDHEIDSDENYRLAHRLDRLFLRAHLGPWDFTVGRGTVSWGPGRFWNPTDYFAAFSPTEIDKEEKIGVDIAQAKVAITPEISAEAVAAPVRRDAHDIDGHGSAAAGRLSARALEADWGLSGGWLYDRSVIGFDVDAIVGDAGVRGALTRTTVEGVPNEEFYRAIVNADYALAWKWNPYVMAEYHFNGFGEDDPDKYYDLMQKPEFLGAYQRGDVVNLGRHYLGAMLTLQPHPLVAVSESLIANLTDTSCYNGFAVTWSALQNLDVLLGAQNTFGPKPSEFGSLENPLTGNDIAQPELYYAYVKFYF